MKVSDKINGLLKGAWDMHVHGYPEISFDVQQQLDDIEVAQEIESAGMRGFVLKSHFWPTVGRSYHLKKRFPSIKILPSITLNTTVGGLNPVSVESAARQGAKVIYMPTWSADNDLKRNGFSRYLRGYIDRFSSDCKNEGLRLLDSKNLIKEDVREIIRIAKTFKMIIATGHVSVEESLAMIDEAGRLDFSSIIFNHPNSHSIGAKIEDMELMASKGAYIEFCALGLMPVFQIVRPDDLKNMIRRIGVDKCILSSDYFFEWAPSPPEMLKLAVSSLLSVGMEEEEIVQIARTNQEKLLTK